MTTGYKIHGWKIGTRIIRQGRFKGTVMDGGRYFITPTSGLWYFKVKWDDDIEMLTQPMTYDRIIENSKYERP